MHLTCHAFIIHVNCCMIYILCDTIVYGCVSDVVDEYEFAELIVTMRIRICVARLYVMSLWILMLQLNLIIVLYISFDGC